MSVSGLRLALAICVTLACAAVGCSQPVRPAQVERLSVEPTLSVSPRYPVYSAEPTTLALSGLEVSIETSSRPLVDKGTRPPRLGPGPDQRILSIRLTARNSTDETMTGFHTVWNTPELQDTVTGKVDFVTAGAGGKGAGEFAGGGQGFSPRGRLFAHATYLVTAGHEYVVLWRLKVDSLVATFTVR